MYKMRRRTFIAFGLIAGIGGIFSVVYGKSGIKGVLRKIHRWTLPDFRVAEGGEDVSVEKVLNSRCNSDWDGDPYTFHWGMFDTTRNLPGEIVEKVIQLARVPRFTDREINILEDSHTLSFVVPNEPDNEIMDLLMLESGMQQQAVGLVCAALGVGMVFDNRGKDGVLLSDTEFETTKIRLGPMKPSYNGSFWEARSPGDPVPWLQGNLPDPERNGDVPFLSALPSVEMEKTGRRTATKKSLGQLLWAARGRTPHYYLSRPWGLTIPTWKGVQTLTTVYVVRKGKAYKYINWEDESPTHFLSEIGNLSGAVFHENDTVPISDAGMIVIGVNEDMKKSLWEAGYQLFNLLVQASALDISWKTIVPDARQKKYLAESGVFNPVIGFLPY